MLIDNTSIAIVGGGPAGLTLARLLQLKNANVKLYERDFNKEARMQGSPLDMHEDSGLAALRKAELLEEFKKTFRPGADKMLIVNEQAEILFSDHDTKPEEDFGTEHFRPEIDRGPLRNMLLDSLQPETVVWDSHFLSMEPQNDGWMLHFKNGTSAYADLVIASDGAHSKIRPYLTEQKPVYSGVIMLEGIISKEHAPHINALINGGKIMAFGKSKNILMGQKGNGDLGFYASFKADENWTINSGLDFSDNTAILQWFKTEYPEWSEIWYELFEKATIPFIPRPIYFMPLDQTWETRSNVTLMGDAAHVMPPFAGEGANMAMLDALELSEYLTNNHYSTLQEAISQYEITMRKRAAAATKDSLENGERMHSETALATMLEFFKGH
ncbi:NAD(P)/FAD-dependent oxidoreductase [Chryseobacterium sp. BIGb0232]|uniref:FAD-dependent oxidoreductase n=1 Tax=Chryseobacterium sp. BIGb0232 TaxID=2940598 RepID=UPI000F4A3775|nr:NAD(P)/FAD-dependent oxidoreductase [Chryseobacterium sp. BIGb0232]MCS4304188.1 2-polyprenyl-6-methoxyphenol hydroxylase-like FAD-dependent oxidoreductase [Chryseobacterium sp. BIGb0232]ROS17767.1 2-polyprenyl-6-methoxyphenol hydroxylase-like FAD-dependent oxidoreductase [Chryseobacterium nakagawai]